ncbi:MAG: RluA family pseudouridine synthase [Roseburia sp.]|nr:RluA family pseudouridine synthase [Roseburia sp.]
MSDIENIENIENVENTNMTETAPAENPSAETAPDVSLRDAVAPDASSRGDADKRPTNSTKVKLRLDVKDVVRKRADDGEDDGSPIILFEDNHLLVAVKPQNVPTQGDSSGDADFLNMLKQYLVKKYNKTGDAFLGLVHRLDRPTGGVMVFAKTSKAAARLCEQIRTGGFEKTYAAVVVGRPNRTGKVEHYLFKDEQNNIVTIAPSSLDGAKKAESVVDIAAEDGGLSLVTIKLITGRTHQARVQLKALGSPIVGDAKYAQKKYVKSKHLALWAYKLVFSHPVSGDKMTFLSVPPQEFPWSAFNTDALVDIIRPTDSGRYSM